METRRDVEGVRYVVLHHTGHGDAHFDLMLEVDPAGPLLTFRLADWPVSVGVDASRLAGHRRAYLTYEGSVSRGRGEVRRVAAGTCALAGSPDADLRVTFLTGPDHEPIRIENGARASVLR